MNPTQGPYGQQQPPQGYPGQHGNVQYGSGQNYYSGPPAARPSAGEWSIRNTPFVAASLFAFVLAVGLIVSLLTRGGDTPTPTSAPAPVAETAAPVTEAEPESYTIEVDFVLYDSTSYRMGCFSGEDGYDDISAGAPVRLTNGGGDLIATDTLGDGSKGATNECVWSLTLDDVPSGEGFYSVEIAGRGEISYTEDELRENDFSMFVSLG